MENKRRKGGKSDREKSNGRYLRERGVNKMERNALHARNVLTEPITVKKKKNQETQEGRGGVGEGRHRKMGQKGGGKILWSRYVKIISPPHSGVDGRIKPRL